MDIASILENCEGFQWDKGNSPKSWLRHQVAEGEAEQAFFNEPLLVLADDQHSRRETRFQALGRTDDQRYLFIVFTVRENLIRVISARDMNRKEKTIYEEFKTDPQV